MKHTILLAATLLMAGSLIAADAPAAADSSAKDAVTAAAKSLAGKNNYSWTTTVVVPAGTRFRPGPTTGQTEKGGYTHVSSTFGDNTTEMVLKGDKAVVSTQDGWQTPTELDSAEGFGRIFAAMARDFKAPATLASDLAAGTAGLKKDGDAYTGDLTEAEVKTLLTFRAGGNAPTVSDAKGTAKFWITDGALAKYETHVTGKVSFNGNDRDVDRTSTTEIKDVDKTKVIVPDDAMKKMNPPAATDEKSKK